MWFTENLVGKTGWIVSESQLPKYQNNANIPIGTEITIIDKVKNSCYDSRGPKYFYRVRHSNGKFSYIGKKCFTVGPRKEYVNFLLTNVKKRKAEIEEKLEYYQSALKFMEDNSLDRINEIEYKAYRVIKEFSKKTSDKEKAKYIAKIINEKL